MAFIQSSHISKEMDKEPVGTVFENPLKSVNAESCLDTIAYLQLNFSLPNNMFTKVERMSMAHSLEVRMPFLDHEFVEYVAAIPASMRFRFWKTKWLLRKAMEPYLPKEILWRKKRGFSVPLYYWLGPGKIGGKGCSVVGRDHRFGAEAWGKMVFDEWQDQDRKKNLNF